MTKAEIVAGRRNRTTRTVTWRSRGAPAVESSLPTRGLPSDQDTDSSAGEDGLAVQFARFARLVQQQGDPEDTLSEIVKAAVALVPGCDEGSISVVLGRRRVTSEAARVSQEGNHVLRKVAETLVHSGVLGD